MMMMVMMLVLVLLLMMMVMVMMLVLLLLMMMMMVMMMVMMAMMMITPLAVKVVHVEPEGARVRDVQHRPLLPREGHLRVDPSVRAWDDLPNMAGGRSSVEALPRPRCLTR